MDEQKPEGKPIIKMTEFQLKAIVSCVVKTREKIPEKDKVVISGEGWKHTFIVTLEKPAIMRGS
ncbi:unnamed protein product [marine sediment metagenome]|uniref:Uncharacterized protein n=1 Tax=marine sediment metagenome TaxID=412755 RepID=X1VQM0_9ZZZZ